MGSVERFAVWRQRVALTDLADDGAVFLRTAEGVAFMEQIHEFFARRIVGVARGWGYDIEEAEVVNMIIDQLLTTCKGNDSDPVRRAAAGEDPWAYLAACTMRWGAQLWGIRGVPIEYAELVPVVEPTRSEYTPLSEVVDLTFALVSHEIPEKHHAAVYELLNWIAANPPQRLTYDVDDRVAAHRHCPSLSIEQVIAVIKIARGSRPRVEETSLMGQFLLNPNFRVASSGTLARALWVTFKNAFADGETGSRMLTDWI